MIPLLVTALVLAQLPRSMPAEGTEGYPQPALKAAIAYERLGMTPLARVWGDYLWLQRDPDTGLWVNWLGETDTVAPQFAVILYEDLGQHERAVTLYRAQAEQARKLPPSAAYNLYWWPLVSAVYVGEPMPVDLLAKAAPGLLGQYSPSEPVDDHGRYYADQMMAWWNWAQEERDGRCANPYRASRPLAPSEGAGLAGTETGGRHLGGDSPYYNSPYRGRRAEVLKYGAAEYAAQMAWRKGEFWWPVIDPTAPFVYYDEVLMLAVLRR